MESFAELVPEGVVALVFDHVAPPSLLYWLGLDEEQGVADDEEDEAEPREDADDAETGCGEVEDEGGQENEHRTEHNPTRRYGEGAAADGLLEVFPGQSSKALLGATLGRVSKAHVSGLLQDLFDLSLVLLRHVVTLGSKGPVGCGPCSDTLLPRSTLRPASI